MNELINKLSRRNGLVNEGNTYRINRVIERARNGASTKIAFIGGSITQGCLATKHENSYTYLIYRWWCERFTKANHQYINAGIGGTTSQYGLARAEEDLLKHNPDVVFIEFSVNDSNDEFYKETYEGLVRKVYECDSKPAVILIHNIKYDDGFTSFNIHNEVGKAYNLPSISMIDTLYKSVTDGQIDALDITEDYLHPNDLGHKLVSQIIIEAIKNLENDNNIIFDEQADGTWQEDRLEVIEKPISPNRFQNSVCIRNDSGLANLYGFIKDTRTKEYYTDIFTNGWIGRKTGDRITFNFKTDYVAVQYRKTINRPAPVARLTIDGNEDGAVILDGNFEEDWGDELHLDTVLIDDKVSDHIINIEIIDGNDAVTDFYITSVIINETE